METINMVLVLILWMIVGFWICWKRSWYRGEGINEDSSTMFCFFTIMGTPLSLLIIIIRVLVIDKWRDLKY